MGNTFFHRIYGSDNQWSILPKRLHSVCFPKIHLASIPERNRINIQLTDTIIQTLPFIPDEFYKQKISKAERPNKPVTRRHKKHKTEYTKRLQTNNFYEGWEVQGVSSTQKHGISKEILLQKLKTCMDEIANNNLVIKNPFGEIDNIEDNEETIDTFVKVAQFVHYYAREEFRMQVTNQNTQKDNTIWEAIKNVLN